MSYPTPQEVNTNSQFMGVCEGLPNGTEKETTVRIFCLTAQKHNSWFLTQEQLDERDTSGSFYWNGLVVEGWFDYPVNNNTFSPTDKFFGRLMAKGLISEVKSETNLKLFKVTIPSQTIKNAKGGKELVVGEITKEGFIQGREIIVLATNYERLWNQSLRELNCEAHEVDLKIEEITGPFEHGTVLSYTQPSGL